MVEKEIPVVPPTPCKVSNFVHKTDTEEEKVLPRPSAFYPRRNSSSTDNMSPRIQRKGKSLDEGNAKLDIDNPNYKTSRSKSMATVEFGGLNNPNRVPLRWQNSPKERSSFTLNNIIRESDSDSVETTTEKHSVTVPSTASNRVTEDDITASDTNKVTNKYLSSRQSALDSSDLRDFRRSLSNTGSSINDRTYSYRKDEKIASDRTRSAVERNESIIGVTPATAYQQYTFARSKTSLNLNSFGGRNEVNNSHNSDPKVDRKTKSPPRLDTKSESKIPARFLKRMQHATSLTEKPPTSGSSDRIMPSASESALKAKIEEAKLEHRNACKDAKNYEYHSKTLPTSSTSPYQRYVNIRH